jgi:hypothetical protein
MNNSLSFIFNIIDCSTLYSIGCQNSLGSGLGNMYCYDAEDGIGAGFGDGSGCSNIYGKGDGSGSGVGYGTRRGDGYGSRIGGLGDGSEDYLDGSGKTSRNEQTLNFIFNIEE